MNNEPTDPVDKVEEAKRTYRGSEKGKLAIKRYTSSPKGRKAQEAYLNSEKGLLAKLRYYNSPKAAKTRQKQKDQRDLMQGYAKFLEANPGTTLADFIASQKENQDG